MLSWKAILGGGLALGLLLGVGGTYLLMDARLARANSAHDKYVADEAGRQLAAVHKAVEEANRESELRFHIAFEALQKGRSIDENTARVVERIREVKSACDVPYAALRLLDAAGLGTSPESLPPGDTETTAKGMEMSRFLALLAQNIGDDTWNREQLRSLTETAEALP